MFPPLLRHFACELHCPRSRVTLLLPCLFVKLGLALAGLAAIVAYRGLAILGLISVTS